MAWTSRALVLLPVIGIAATAHADGDESALSLGVSFATFSEPGKATNNSQPTTITPHGGGTLSLSYERAFATDFSLRAELAGGGFYGGTSTNAKNPGHGSIAGLADVGVTFRFDVLRYVPYAFGGVGVLASDGGPLDNGFAPVLVVGGGLDVLQSRAWSWGLEIRVAGFASDTTVFTIGLRGTRRWGYL